MATYNKFQDFTEQLARRVPLRDCVGGFQCCFDAAGEGKETQASPQGRGIFTDGGLI